jgi:hypothetical protein
MRVRRNTFAYDAWLAEFTMFLVAQAKGLGYDTAATRADFLSDFCEDVDAVFPIKARIWLGSAASFMDGKYQVRHQAIV